MATRQAQFGRRKEPIQFEIGSPTPSRLVFQFAEYFAKRRIRRSIASRLAPALRFEGWILRPLLEEIREGHIEITQRLLKHNGTDFGKKGFSGSFFHSVSFEEVI